LSIAKGVYQQRANSMSAPILPIHCERDLRSALIGSVSFSTYLGNQRHLPFTAHFYLALAVARYMLDYEFGTISSP
jgi:hypothetical protein